MNQQYITAKLTHYDTQDPTEVFEDLIATHSPFAFYLFNWINFHSDAFESCVELLHDIQCIDGRVLHQCMPHRNGTHFVCIETDEIIYPSHISLIRLSKKQILMPCEWTHPTQALYPTKR
ncbi:hypothetical protein EAG18_08395 [Pseudoalteromonas sp. J010]|uniref:hypothetical protein n=1 Tax=Pseudoalteromonas sp. J010 TaxID=998465 RepID=UPI000F6457D9|nr:hypothetical protein [Pseudoalteromonas sp. J010]RRS09130.1 hypothetical protein EAG18_08395 [Pseudoalteromonas sp. J010]